MGSIADQRGRDRHRRGRRRRRARRSCSCTASARTRASGAPQLDHFGERRRAIAFDYPGYGESEFVDGATRDDFAAPIARRDGRAGDRARAYLRPVARRSGRDRHACRGARALRLADHRRQLRGPSRRPGDPRPLGRRQPGDDDARAGRGARAGCCSAAPRPTRCAPRSIDDHGRDRSRRLSPRRARRCGWPTSATAPRRSTCRRWSWSATRIAITPPALSRRAGRARSPASRLVEIIADAGHLANAEQPARLQRRDRPFLAEVEQCNKLPPL